MTNYKVIISGGGPARTALAIRLCRAGISPIAIIEAHNYNILLPGETLPALGVDILKDLGMDSEQLSAHLLSMGTIACWNSDKPYTNASFDQRRECLHLQRPLFDRQLADLAVSNGVELMTESAVKETKWESNKWSITVKNSNKSHVISADFLVDAGGRRASVSHKLGARRLVHGDLLGYYRNLPLEKSLPVASFIEARPEGWWYVAPIPDKRLAVVFMTTPKIGKELELNQPIVWQQKLSETIHIKQLVGQDKMQPVKVFSACTSLMDQDYDPKTQSAWLGVGDAACTWDPLSSQGIYKALSHGQWAGHAINDYLNGKPNGLQKYKILLECEYNTYLKNFNGFYHQETRWPHSIFWKTMQGRITLSPHDQLCCGETNLRRNARLPIESSLVNRLRKIAKSPVRAVELMDQMKTHARVGDVEHHILWLQQLVRQGYLKLIRETS